MGCAMSTPMKWLLFGLILCGLLPASFMIDSVGMDHFLSSHHIFEHAFKHDFRFGIDLIDNVGPYGFLHYPYTYAGGAFFSKFAWFALLCMIYAYYSMRLTSQLSSWPEKCLFVFCVVYFPFQVSFPWFSYEVLPRIAILFSALYLLARKDSRPRWSEHLHLLGNGVFYGALLLEKASNVYYLVVVLLTLSVYWALQKRWMNILSLSATTAITTLLLWVLAGQPMSIFITYFSSMRMFIDAYQHVMLEDISWYHFSFGIFYCVAMVVLLGLRLKLSLKSLLSFHAHQKASRKVVTTLARECGYYLLVGALFFLSWKHGMLRGVHSYGTFLYLVPILFAFLCLFPVQMIDARQAGPQGLQQLLKPGFSWPRLLICLALLLVVQVNAKQYRLEMHVSKSILSEFQQRVSALMHYRLYATLDNMKARYDQAQQENALPPPLKEKLAKGTVDEFGSMPEVILLNKLNYRARPVPIDFIVANKTLNEKNAQFYQQTSGAPDYILLPEFGFRVSDVSAYLRLLLNYRVVDEFQHWVVMERKSSRQIDAEEIIKKNIQLGEWVSIESWQTAFLWTQLLVQPSLIGRLKHLFYKPDRIDLELQLADDSVKRFTVSLPQLRSGLLLNPMIRSKTMLRFVAHDTKDQVWDIVKAFRVIPKSPLDGLLFSKKITAEFSKILVSSSVEQKRQVLTLLEAQYLIQPFSAESYVSSTCLPFDLLSKQPRSDIVLSGWGGIEQRDDFKWRWGLAPKASVVFYSAPETHTDTRSWLLQLSFKNELLIPHQTLTVHFNGAIVRHFSDLDLSQEWHINLPLSVQPGINRLELTYGDWNHGKHDYVRRDPRNLGLMITRFTLEEGAAL